MTIVFCECCGACLGEQRPNFAKEHIERYPNHDSFLAKVLVDPLKLSDDELKRHLELIPNSLPPVLDTRFRHPDYWTVYTNVHEIVRKLINESLC